MKTLALLHSMLAVCVATLSAQVPDSPPAAPAPAPAGSAAPAPAATKPAGSMLGKDVPVFDPGSEVATWDGKSWNINNNRLFQARFEKYLNAPEETGPDTAQYRLILTTIMDKLAPGKVTPKSVDEAFRLLPRASKFDIDAHLCDALADAVLSVWRVRGEQDRLARANEVLEQERRAHEWNTQVALDRTKVDVQGPPPGATSKGPGAAQFQPQNGTPAPNSGQGRKSGVQKGGGGNPQAEEWAKEQQQKRELAMQPYQQRNAETQAQMKLNDAKVALTSVQAKIEFQLLITQFFLQRRFQHVVMASRFYRAVFGDGETRLYLGDDAKAFVEKSVGMPLTVATLDSLADEAMREAREGVKAYEFLLGKEELESATKRLAEAFTIGEYLPELRLLPREKKRQALAFSQQANQLLSALEMKDYGLAENLVEQLGKTAKDFDNSKPTAAIETARTVSAMHLAKARNAAVAGDQATLEQELKSATEIWPRNPALAEVSGRIFAQGDKQQQALVDLEQLMAQRNYRRVYEDRARFIAAASQYPERQNQLREVLENMQTIEGAIMQSQELSRRGDHAGAWESAEKAFRQFPDDGPLNQLRAELTTRAADYVRTLRTAEKLEEKKRLGSSLAWYLKAQKSYPAGQFAQEAITRLVKEIVPEQ